VFDYAARLAVVYTRENALHSRLSAMPIRPRHPSAALLLALACTPSGSDPTTGLSVPDTWASSSASTSDATTTEQTSTASASATTTSPTTDDSSPTTDATTLLYDVGPDTDTDTAATRSRRAARARSTCSS
jgi:hypothetical protein